MAKIRHPAFWLAISLGVALFAFMVTPAGAHFPTANNANFNPDEHNGDGQLGFGTAAHGPDTAAPETKEAQIISDLFDGIDSTYQLRAVATTNTAFYEWYDCTNTGHPFPPTTAGECLTVVATDTTPKITTPPPGGSAIAAFSASYDISQFSQANSPRSIHGVACQTDASSTPDAVADSAHCISIDPDPTEGTTSADGSIENVHTDNASSTNDHTSPTDSGEIFCVRVAGVTQCGEDVHGTSLPNGQPVTLVGFTNAESIDAIHFCWDEGSNTIVPNNDTPNGTGGGCLHNGVDDSAPTTGPADAGACAPGAPAVPEGADCWSATLTPDPNTEFGVSMIEFDPGGLLDMTNSGSGDCAGDTSAGDPLGLFDEDGDDCQLDKVYLNTSGAVPTPTPTPTASPSPSPTGSPSPSPTGSPSPSPTGSPSPSPSPSPSAQRLNVEPEAATTLPATTHTLTATVTNASNQPIQGVNVDFEVTGGPNANLNANAATADRECFTNSAGQCSVSYTGGPNVGTDNIRGWIDTNDDDAVPGEADTAEGPNEATTPGNTAEPDPTDVVTKTWGTTTPTPTPTQPPSDCQGTSGNDILVGTNGADNCNGFGGDDTIRTLKGSDTGNGGSGSDTIRLAAGNDTGIGGAGNDSAFGGPGADTLRLGGGNDTGIGGGGRDTISCGPGNDSGRGGKGNDTIKPSCESRRQ